MIYYIVNEERNHSANLNRQSLVFCDVPNFWRAAGHHRYILFVNEIWFVAMNTKAHFGFPEACDLSFLFGFIVSVGIGLFSLVILAVFEIFVFLHR